MRHDPYWIFSCLRPLFTFYNPYLGYVNDVNYSVYPWGRFKTGGGILKLGSIYPRYVGHRLIVPWGILDGGMLDLLHRYSEHTPIHNINMTKRLQTTQPTSGGAVTADSSRCANCVEPPRPQQWGPDLPFFGHAGHADPLDGWRCCSQKRVMSRPIQVRQL